MDKPTRHACNLSIHLDAAVSSTWRGSHRIPCHTPLSQASTPKPEIVEKSYTPQTTAFTNTVMPHDKCYIICPEQVKESRAVLAPAVRQSFGSSLESAVTLRMLAQRVAQTAIVVRHKYSLPCGRSWC